jgi:asparagine N-glycosylation enzyme membrane subunit Stt3
MSENKQNEKIEIDFSILAKNWVLISLILIFVLAFYVRTFNFHYDYLLNVDSYFQYRYIKFVADGGIPQIDYFMAAPEGMKTGLATGVSNIYHYIGGYSYLFTKIFFPNLELWVFLIYLPAILASLMLIPAYFIGKTLFDKKAGVLLAFLVAFNPAIFMRSLGGDPDTDAIVMIMPLFVMMFFILAIKAVEASNKLNNVKAILFSAATGIFLAAFAFTWVGYWYILYLIVGFVFLKIILDIAMHFNENKHIESLKSEIPLLFNLLIMLLIFIIITSRVFAPSFYVDTIFQPFSATQLKSEGGEYPNVFVSVQEMMSTGGIKDIIQRAGTTFFFLTFVLCLPYLVGTYIKKKTHMDTTLIILMWSFGALAATFMAVRFGILLAIPVSIGSAIIISKMWRMVLGEDKEIFE